MLNKSLPQLFSRDQFAPNPFGIWLRNQIPPWFLLIWWKTRNPNGFECQWGKNLRDFFFFLMGDKWFFCFGQQPKSDNPKNPKKILHKMGKLQALGANCEIDIKWIVVGELDWTRAVHKCRNYSNWKLLKGFLPRLWGVKSSRLIHKFSAEIA